MNNFREEENARTKVSPSPEKCEEVAKAVKQAPLISAAAKKWLQPSKTRIQGSPGADAFSVRKRPMVRDAKDDNPPSSVNSSEFLGRHEVKSSLNRRVSSRRERQFHSKPKKSFADKNANYEEYRLF